MKIPASSSVILATLAISSSSASLAAPTGEAQNTGSSLQHPHARQAMENEEKGEAHVMERDSETHVLEARGCDPVSTVLVNLPVVGPVLANILCPDPNSAQAASADPAALQRLQDAVGTVSSVLTGLMPTGVPVAGLPVPSGLPVPGAAPTGAVPNFGAKGADDDSDPNNSPPSPVAGDPSDSPSPDSAPAGNASDGSPFLISPTTTVASAEEATPGPQDPEYLSAGDGATPTSPGVPSGPPNTPVPVNSTPASG